MTYCSSSVNTMVAASNNGLHARSSLLHDAPFHYLEHVNIFSKWKSRPMTWKDNDVLLYFRDQKGELPASSVLGR